MTLEQKWDRIWPLACSAAAAIEAFDRNQDARDGARVLHYCRELKKSVDEIVREHMTTSDEVRRLPGSGPADVPKRFYVDFYNQWDGVFSGSNRWYDFTLIKLAGEYGCYKGSVEIEISILGLCWTFTYVYDSSFTESLKGMAEEIKDESRRDSAQ